jgi:hypothetical protein
MLMRMKFLLTVFFLATTLGFAQTFEYDILLIGSDVGDMSITRKISGSKTTYRMESRTEVNYIIDSRKDVFVSTIELENNVLVSSRMENKKNDKLHEFTYVTRGNGGYKVQTEKGLSTIAGNIIKVVYDIFYAEPKGGEALFVDRSGKFGTVSKVKDHAYKVEIKGGDDYTYNYEGGKMVKMEVPSPLGKVKMVIK